MNTNETSIIACRHCGETKERVMAGRYANHKDVRWIDPVTKLQWNGHTCPPCHKEKVAARKRTKAVRTISDV